MRTQFPPVTKAEIVSLDELIRQIEHGRVQIPKFQRPFVWGPNDILMLFDSINKGYPIGSLVLWSTDTPLDSSRQLGPLELPSSSEPITNYILDGQQRLAVLYCVLRLPADFPCDSTESHWVWWVFYDLRERRFVHVRNRSRREPWHMPMRAISKTVDYLREIRSIQQALGEDQAVPLIEEADALAQRVKTYRMTLNYIHGGGLEDVTVIFSRLNSAGKKLSAAQLTSALHHESGGSGERSREGNGSHEKNRGGSRG
jgi:hypothetical protein